MSNNCPISLYGEEFPISDFCLLSCIEFPIFDEIIFVWCDMLGATTIQEPSNLSSSLIAGKINQFAASYWQLWKSTYIEYIGTFLCLFFPLPFPFSLLWFFLFVPWGIGGIDFPLPLFGFFPPGQWFCVLWFIFPHFAHFWPKFLTVENLLRDESLSIEWAFLLDSSWSTHAMMSESL